MQGENITEAVPESAEETAEEADLSTLVDISMQGAIRLHKFLGRTLPYTQYYTAMYPKQVYFYISLQNMGQVKVQVKRHKNKGRQETEKELQEADAREEHGLEGAESSKA